MSIDKTDPDAFIRRYGALFEPSRAGGERHAPAFIAENLPRRRYAHTSEAEFTSTWAPPATLEAAE